MATLRKITLNWEIRTGAITCDTGYIKRQELCDVDLYVTVDGTAYALDTSWALNLSIKPALLGDNAALIAVTTWTASATTGLYQATAQTMGGTALDTYLAANNADTTDDEGNKLVDLDVYYTISTAVKSKSDTVTVILKPDVGRADDTVPATIIARNDFLVTNGTGLLVNVAAGYAANGAFVAAQASLAITNATNYIEVTAAGVASVNTTAFTAGSYPLATVVASAGAITSNTDLRAWITPKPGAAGGVTSITGTANEITVTGTTTPTLSLPTALTFTGKTVTGGTFTGGAFNGTVGATTPSTVAGTTGTFSGTLTVNNITYANNSIVVSNPSTATIGIDINPYNAPSQVTAGHPWMRIGGGSSDYLMINAGLTGGYVDFCTDLGSGVRVWDGTGGHKTYLTSPADGTLRVTTNGSTLGTVDAATFTGNAATVTTNANLTGHVTSTGNAVVLGSFTMAQLSTAVSDGDPAYVGAANTFTTGQTISATTSLLLGTAGSAVGDIGFRNATSGTTTLAPATGALGTGTVTLPLSGTLATLEGANTFTAENINSKSGAASVTAMKFTGVPFAGTGTTSFPLVYITDANATASSTLNTAGTYFGVNGDGTQDLMNLMADGVSKVRVKSTGEITVGIPTGSGGSMGMALQGPLVTGSTSTSGFYLAGSVIQGHATATIGFTQWGRGDVGSNDVAFSRTTSTANSMSLGNGTAGNTSGTLLLANLTASGTLAVTGATTLTGNLTSNGALISTPQALSGNGAVAAVNLTTLTTTIANTGTANTTTTLAAGTNGQTKIISFITDGGFDAVVTVTNPAWGGAGTITMNDALDNVMLIYLNSVWQVFINNGCTLA